MPRIFGNGILAWIATICLYAVAHAQSAGTMPYGKWRALEINGAATATNVESTLTLSKDGSAYGKGACNHFRAKADMDGKAMTLSSISRTMMHCSDEQMQQERRFLKALSSTVRWEITDGALLLYAKSGEIAARLEPADAEARITIPLPRGAIVGRQSLAYRCKGRSIDVDYINAGSVSLAVLHMDDEMIVASQVLSASGARYAGDRYIWWSKGDGATLQDLTKGEDQPPANCIAQQ